MKRNYLKLSPIERRKELALLATIILSKESYPMPFRDALKMAKEIIEEAEFKVMCECDPPKP